MRTASSACKSCKSCELRAVGFELRASSLDLFARSSRLEARSQLSLQQAQQNEPDQRQQHEDDPHVGDDLSGNELGIGGDLRALRSARQSRGNGHPDRAQRSSLVGPAALAGLTMLADFAGRRGSCGTFGKGHLRLCARGVHSDYAIFIRQLFCRMNSTVVITITTKRCRKQEAIKAASYELRAASKPARFKLGARSSKLDTES